MPNVVDAIDNFGYTLDKNDSELMHQNYNELKAEILGIVTLEDVIEKMINIQILDEDDYRRQKAKKKKMKEKKIY